MRLQKIKDVILYGFFHPLEPSKVSNLKATDIQDTSLTVGWKQPEGKFTVYHVTVKFNQKE